MQLVFSSITLPGKDAFHHLFLHHGIVSIHFHSCWESTPGQISWGQSCKCTAPLLGGKAVKVRHDAESTIATPCRVLFWDSH